MRSSFINGLAEENYTFKHMVFYAKINCLTQVIRLNKKCDKYSVYFLNKMGAAGGLK